MALQKLFYKKCKNYSTRIEQEHKWTEEEVRRQYKRVDRNEPCHYYWGSLRKKLGRKGVLASHMQCTKDIERLCGRIEYSATCCPRLLSRRHIDSTLRQC